MNSGGSGDWRSRGSRDAMPKPVSHALPSWRQQHVGRLDILVDETCSRAVCEVRPIAQRRFEKTARPPSASQQALQAARRRAISGSTSCDPARAAALTAVSAHALSRRFLSPDSCARRSTPPTAGPDPVAASTAHVLTPPTVIIAMPYPGSKNASPVPPQDLELPVPSRWRGCSNGQHAVSPGSSRLSFKKPPCPCRRGA